MASGRAGQRVALGNLSRLLWPYTSRALGRGTDDPSDSAVVLVDRQLIRSCAARVKGTLSHQEAGGLLQASAVEQYWVLIVSAQTVRYEPKRQTTT